MQTIVLASDYEHKARRLEGEANAHEADAALCRRQAEEARKVAEYIRKRELTRNEQ